MQRSYRMDDCKDYHRDREGNCSAPYGHDVGHYKMPVAQSDCVLSGESVSSDALPMGYPAPMMVMPADLWHLIGTYLVTADAMSLRCTASVVQGHLKGLSDAVFDGCRMIDQLTQRGVDQSILPLVYFDAVRTLPLNIRCDMLKRYARHAGMDCSADSGHIAPGKAEPPAALKGRYFISRLPVPGSEHDRSVRSWSNTIATTKAALHDVTFDTSCSIALSDLYAAEMFAPLLGVVADPRAHVERVMRDAATLSSLRWMDFLYAVAPLKHVCVSVLRAYQTLFATFDRHQSMPRIEVLAGLVHTSLSFPNRHSIREVCLHQMGISLACLTGKIIPRVTCAIVDAILTDPLIRGIDVAERLQCLSERWGDDDGFAASLHQAFLTAIAKRTHGESTPSWPMLPESTRVALQTRVLGISPNDADLCGLFGRTVLDFWALYFEIADSNTTLALRAAASRLEALPWPLKAALWKFEADVHANPHSALLGAEKMECRFASVAGLDALCLQALYTDKFVFALPALQATLRWKVTDACHALWDSIGADASPIQRVDPAGIRPSLAFSELECLVYEGAEIAARLPFIAELFSYREVLTQCGYDWTFDSLLSEDVVSFLCDPTSRLVRPALDVIDVLMHYLPLCGKHLPEFRLGRKGCEAAFAKRFGLPSADMVLTAQLGSKIALQFAPLSPIL